MHECMDLHLAAEIFRKPFAPYFLSRLADYFWVSAVFELL